MPCNLSSMMASRKVIKGADPKRTQVGQAMRGLLGPAKLAEPVRRALGAEVQVQRQEPWEPEQQGDVIALLALIPTKRYKKRFVIKRNKKKKIIEFQFV